MSVLVVVSIIISFIIPVIISVFIAFFAAILIAAGFIVIVAAMVLRLTRFVSPVIIRVRTPVAGKCNRAQREYQNETQQQTNHNPIFPAHANTPFPR